MDHSGEGLTATNLTFAFFKMNSKPSKLAWDEQILFWIFAMPFMIMTSYNKLKKM